MTIISRANPPGACKCLNHNPNYISRIQLAVRKTQSESEISSSGKSRPKKSVNFKHRIRKNVQRKLQKTLNVKLKVKETNEKKKKRTASTSIKSRKSRSDPNKCTCKTGPENRDARKTRKRIHSVKPKRIGHDHSKLYKWDWKSDVKPSKHNGIVTISTRDVNSHRIDTNGLNSGQHKKRAPDYWICECPYKGYKFFQGMDTEFCQCKDKEFCKCKDARWYRYL